MKPLKPLEAQYWEAYLNTLPLDEREEPRWVEANFAGNAEVTDGLIALYLGGKKSAGSGLVQDYLAMGDPLPKVGNYWIVLASDGTPKLILKTIRIETNLFSEIPERIAIAEGEGDLSVKDWKMLHERFFKPYLSRWGVKDLESAEVITEHFEIVYR